MMARDRSIRWLALWILAGAALGTPARAQGLALNQEAVAETLFQDARKLMQEGRFAQACPKLAESHSMDPAGGTVLLLALCYEQVGKTASAWVKFHDALATARRDGRKDREDRAREHLQKLEPLLSRIALNVSPEASTQQGLSLWLDGSEVPPVAWSRLLPADPGSHVVEAKAPGRQTWSTTLVLAGGAASEQVVVPALLPLPAPDLTAPPAPSKPAVSATPVAQREARVVSPASRSWLAYVVGGLGVAAVGVGGYFGVRALERDADARDRCPGNDCTDGVGVQLNEDARSDATRANVLIGGGLALVGVGAYLWLSAPDPSERGTALRVRPQGPATGATVEAITRW